MRTRRKTVWLLLSVAIVLIPVLSAGELYSFCSETEDQPSECIRDLVKNWAARDGAGHEEFSTKLSMSFVAHPRLLLGELTKVPADFDAWLQDLGGNTFYIYDPKGSVTGEMWGAAHAALRDLMLNQAQSLSEDPTYAEPAGRLVAVLEDIEIRWME